MNQFLVCVLACVAVALAEHERAEHERAEHGHDAMQAAKKQCQTQVGATDADAAAMRPVPTTRGASCILACLEKKWGTMNADNTFNSAVAIQKLSRMQEKNPTMYNKMVTVINTCKAQETPQSDQCDAAKALATCMQTQRAAQGITGHHH